MKFTLIVATLGRDRELERLFDSLHTQTYRGFEVLVVDQNSDERASRVVDRYRGTFPIRIIKSDPGLSKARNIGLAGPLGDIVAIPDDDCWYQPNTLSVVVQILTNTPGLAGITGKSVDEHHRPSQGRWSDVELTLDASNIWRAATSYTIFLRREVFEKIGKFDETLGVGSGTKWGSGEEVELLLRALKAGYAVRYVPTLEIHHPDPVRRIDAKAYARCRTYNRGLGRVLRLADYHLYFVGYMVARPGIGALIALARLSPALSRYRLIAAVQRLRGWLDA
jgi:glycosyltransferase involved in cell wall biosynthesis